jgi:uncharacterized membrane protein YfcA
VEAVVVGFVVALAIGLTGVGGGTLAAPLLIFFLRLKAAVAVGTALTFAAAIKILVVPLYAARKQIDYGILAWMVAGGLPGVLIGGRFLIALSKTMDQRALYLALGIIIVIASLLNIYRILRPPSIHGERNRPRTLAAAMFPVGIEMGFSSAGAGALGSLALLGLTKLDAAPIVGTGLVFGLVLAAIGSGIQISAGNIDVAVLERMLIGGVVGGFAGGVLAHRIPSRPLKWGMAAFLAVLGVQLLMRGIGV